MDLKTPTREERETNSENGAGLSEDPKTPARKKDGVPSSCGGALYEKPPRGKVQVVSREKATSLKTGGHRPMSKRTTEEGESIQGNGEKRLTPRRNRGKEKRDTVCQGARGGQETE